MRRYRVGGLDCSGCASSLVRAVSALGVGVSAAVDMYSSVLEVDGRVTDDAVAQAVVRAGYEYFGPADRVPISA